jgi:hypothetical protein
MQERIRGWKLDFVRWPDRPNFASAPRRLVAHKHTHVLATTRPRVEPAPLELVHFRAAHTEERAQPREEARTHVVNSRSPDGAAWAVLCAAIEILKESVIMLGSGTVELTFRERLKQFWQNILNNYEELRDLTFWFAFTATIFIGLSIGSTFVSYLQSDSIALSVS